MTLPLRFRAKTNRDFRSENSITQHLYDLTGFARRAIAYICRQKGAMAGRVAAIFLSYDPGLTFTFEVRQFVKLIVFAPNLNRQRGLNHEYS